MDAAEAHLAEVDGVKLDGVMLGRAAYHEPAILGQADRRLYGEPAEDTEAMPLPVEGRSSFRKGFLLVMTFAILGAALYVSAGALSNAVPSLAGFLEAYVGFIDSLRLQLDGLMQSATLAINGT